MAIASAVPVADTGPSLLESVIDEALAVATMPPAYAAVAMEVIWPVF